MTKSKKLLVYTLIFGGILFFILSVIGIIIDAINMDNNIALAVMLGWIFFGTLLISMIAIIIGIVLFFIFNKERIKNYLSKIMNK